MDEFLGAKNYKEDVNITSSLHQRTTLNTELFTDHFTDKKQEEMKVDPKDEAVARVFGGDPGRETHPLPSRT